MSLWFTKISILLLYLRILTYSWAKMLTYIIIVITMTTSIFTLITVLTACIPLSAWWDVNIVGVCQYD